MVRRKTKDTVGAPPEPPGLSKRSGSAGIVAVGSGCRVHAARQPNADADPHAARAVDTQQRRRATPRAGMSPLATPTEPFSPLATPTRPRRPRPQRLADTPATDRHRRRPRRRRRQRPPRSRPGRPSKLGLFVTRNDPRIFDLLRTGNVTLVKTLEYDPNFVAEIKSISPKTSSSAGWTCRRSTWPK